MVSRNLKNKMDEVKDELSICLKQFMQEFLKKGHDNQNYRETIMRAISEWIPSKTFSTDSTEKESYPNYTISEEAHKYSLAVTAGYERVMDELEKTSDPQAIFNKLTNHPYFKIYFILHYLETQTEDAAWMSSKKTWGYIYDLNCIRNDLSHKNYDYDDAHHLTSIAYNIGHVFNDESILKLQDELFNIIKDERPDHQSRLSAPEINEKEAPKTKKQEPSISREKLTAAVADSNKPSLLSSDLLRNEIDVDSYLKIEELSMPELAERSETDSLASAYMAYCYYSGIRVHQDIEQAKELAEKTINNKKDFKGRYFGYYILAHLYKNEGDLEKYSQYLHYSIDWNGVDAKYDLALEYLKGSEIFPKSIEKATELLDYTTRRLLPKASTLLALIKLDVFSKRVELHLSELLSDNWFFDEIIQNPSFNEAYELLKSSSERGEKLAKLLRIQLLNPYEGFINADEEDKDFIISEAEANDSITLYGLAVGIEMDCFGEKSHNAPRTLGGTAFGRFSSKVNLNVYRCAIEAGSEDAILRLYLGAHYELQYAKDGSSISKLEEESGFTVYDYVNTVEKLSKTDQSLTILANAYHDFPMIKDKKQSYKFANELSLKIQKEGRKVIPSTVYCILLEECQEMIHNDRTPSSIERCVSKLRTITNHYFDVNPTISEFEVANSQIDKVQYEVLSELIELISLDDSNIDVSIKTINDLVDIIYQTIRIQVSPSINKIKCTKHGNTHYLLPVGDIPTGSLENVLERLTKEYEQKSVKYKLPPDSVHMRHLKDKIDIITNMKENGIQCAEEIILDALSDIYPDKKIYYTSETISPYYFPSITYLSFSPTINSGLEYTSWSDFGYIQISAQISPLYLLEVICSTTEIEIFADWKIPYHYRLLSVVLAKYYLKLANTLNNESWSHKAVLLLTYACLPQDNEKRLYQFSPSEGLMLLSECYASGIGIGVDKKRSQQYLLAFNNHQDPTEEEIKWAYGYGLFGE